MNSQSSDENNYPQAEAWVALAYFAVYMGYP
jgi:hypothetical protein